MEEGEKYAKETINMSYIWYERKVVFDVNKRISTKQWISGDIYFVITIKRYQYEKSETNYFLLHLLYETKSYKVRIRGMV